MFYYLITQTNSYKTRYMKNNYNKSQFLAIEKIIRNVFGQLINLTDYRYFMKNALLNVTLSKYNCTLINKLR